MPRAQRPRVRDLLRESGLSTIRSPGRTLLTGLGALLAALAYVGASTVLVTARQQVSSQFDAQASTEIVVSSSKSTAGSQPPDWASPAALAAAGRLVGVAHAGRLITSDATVRASALPASVAGAADDQVSPAGIDLGSQQAIAPHVISGRLLDAADMRAGFRVALIPKELATQLGGMQVTSTIWIGDVGFTVIGVFDDLGRRKGLQASPLIPTTSYLDVFGGSSSRRESVLVSTTVGAAAPVVASQIALALEPSQQAQLQVVSPPTADSFRRSVSRDLDVLVRVASLIILAFGGFSIANAATSSVATRAPEIGLRAVLGAQRGSIAAQIITETGLTAIVGGIVGTYLGLLGAVITSLALGWAPVIDYGGLGLAVAACFSVGVVAGVVPAIRAASIEPARALVR